MAACHPLAITERASVGMLRAASRSRGLGMRAASRSLALSSVFARGMAISVGDAFPKGVNVQAPPSRCCLAHARTALLSRPAPSCLPPHRRHRETVNSTQTLLVRSALQE